MKNFSDYAILKTVGGIMTKTIKFIASDPYAATVCPKPIPASQVIPDYWRNATPYMVSEDNPDGKKLILRNRNSNASFKKCTPMLDAMTSGYMFTLWADVMVTQVNGFPSISWRVEKDVFQLHGGAVGIDFPDGYHKVAFKYLNHWHPRTPDGYSILVTPPLGHRNLPFMPISAVIDTDRTPHELVPPGFIKEGFEGIIEKGTPMFQVTPFKRESWVSEFDNYKENEFNAIMDRDVSATLVNNYVKNFWQKKSYK